jgi:hypothetical protein
MNYSASATTMTVAQASRYFRRTPRRIQQWCRDGSLLAFNYGVVRESSGRWLIIIPAHTLP